MIKYIGCILKELIMNGTINVDAWFNRLKRIGIEDIQLHCPCEVDNIKYLSFSNTSRSMIFCFNKRGETVLKKS